MQSHKKKKKNKNKKSFSAKRIAMLGIFTALALVFSYIETFIKIDFAVPGIKIGLANIVTIIVLYSFGICDAVIVSVLRIFLSALLFGNVMVLVYSLAGAALSIIVMWVISQIKFFSVTGISILGGVAHNMGQLIAACLIIKNQNVLIYAPVLIASGTIAGILVGLAASLIIKTVGGQLDS